MVRVRTRCTLMLASEGLLIARVEDASERQAAPWRRRGGAGRTEKFAQDADAQHDTVMFGMIGVLLVILWAAGCTVNGKLRAVVVRRESPWGCWFRSPICEVSADDDRLGRGFIGCDDAPHGTGAVLGPSAAFACGRH